MHLTHDPATPPAPQISFDQFLAVEEEDRAIRAIDDGQLRDAATVADFGDGEKLLFQRLPEREPAGSVLRRAEGAHGCSPVPGQAAACGV